MDHVPTLKDDSDAATVELVHAAIMQLQVNHGDRIRKLGDLERYLQERIGALQASQDAASGGADPDLEERGNAAFAWLDSVRHQQVSHIGDTELDWNEYLGAIRSMSRAAFVHDKEAIERVEVLRAQYSAFTGRPPRRKRRQGRGSGGSAGGAAAAAASDASRRPKRAREAVQELPSVAEGVVVHNGDDYYAIQLTDGFLTADVLYSEALKFIARNNLTGEFTPPLSWTEYGLRPLGPHISLTSTPQPAVGEAVVVSLGAWHTFEANGSRWVAISCAVPSHLACEYECHISCAQQRLH